MSGSSVSLRFAVPFGKAKRAAGPKRPPSRVARMIALAHHIDDLIERGVVQSYGQVARALGVIDTRLVQIMDLTLLSPLIQEALLEGRVVISPRKAQKLTRLGLWEEQERGLAEVSLRVAIRIPVNRRTTANPVRAS